MENLDDKADKKGSERKETFKSFMNNPAGAGVAFNNRKYVVEGLEDSYAKLLAATGGKFKYRVFQVGSSILFHVLVSSESIEDFFYDVVIEFEDSVKASDLSKSNIRLFSNAPSFTFTYAYAFNFQGLLTPYCAPLVNRRALTEIPQVKNTELVTGYEKTLFFALFFIEKNNLFNRSNFGNQLIKANAKSFIETIKDDDSKLEEYKYKKGVAAAKNKSAKNKTVNLSTQKRTTTKTTNLDTGKSTYTKKIYNKVDNVVDNKVNSKVNNKVNSKVDNKVNKKVRPQSTEKDAE